MLRLEVERAIASDSREEHCRWHGAYRTDFGEALALLANLCVLGCIDMEHVFVDEALARQAAGEGQQRIRFVRGRTIGAESQNAAAGGREERLELEISYRRVLK